MKRGGEVSLLIDPREDPALAASDEERCRLFAPGSEYENALRAVLATPAAATIPDEVFLHLFAYETLERSRERWSQLLVGRAAVLVIPLWPASLFEAAGVGAHAARELESLFPPFHRVRVAGGGPDENARAMVVHLGAVRVDPATYAASLSRTAEMRGWEVV